MRTSPTLDTLAVFAVVFLLQRLLPVAGIAGWFVLAPPLDARPYTLVTSVYAHAGLGHLLANAVALVLGRRHSPHGRTRSLPGGDRP